MNKRPKHLESSVQNQNPNGASQNQRTKVGAGIIVLVTISVLGIVGLVCSGIGIWLVSAGGDVMADEVIIQIENDANFVREIGTVSSKSFNWYETLLETDEQDRICYTVEGNNGTGTVFADSYTDENNIEQVYYAKLRTDDGEEFDLQIDNAAPYRQ